MVVSKDIVSRWLVSLATAAILGMLILSSPVAWQQALALLVGLQTLLIAGGLAYGHLKRRSGSVKTRHQLSHINRLDHYILESKIGEGGMGIVYRARHALLRRPVAVKLLSPAQNIESSVKRFEREVQLTSQLTHPNTIQIYDYGRTSEGLFYYAMEYLDGIDLKTLVEHHGPLPEARLIHLLLQACAALKEAHQAGLVHSDIKPANMIVTTRGSEYDILKLLDFGLVTNVFHSTDQSAGAGDEPITGSPNYLSPERIQNQWPIDSRSDLYSLGAVAYYLLTGTEPFAGETATEICRQHVEATPQRPSERTGCSYDETLQSLIMRCLAKQPADRPSSAAALIESLLCCESAGQWSQAEAQTWWRRFHARRDRRAPRAADHTAPPKPSLHDLTTDDKTVLLTAKP